VVKAFAAPRPWSRGAFKARREARVLRALAERGLPVPRLLGSERRGGWSLLHLERLPLAMDLSAWLERPGLSRAERRDLLKRVAATLASFQAAGLRQGDAHPGNWLIAADGRPVAIDFERARLCRRFRLRAARSELARLAALLRPVTSAGERRRSLAAWRAALPAEIQASLPAEPAFARALARQAEQVRRREIRRELDRWLRPGSRLEALARAAPSAVGPARPHDAAGAAAHSAACLLNRRLSAGQRALAQGWCEGAPIPAGGLASSAPPRRARRLWLAVALEHEHGLPVLLPAALDPREPHRWRLLFLFPETDRAPQARPAPMGWSRQLEARRARLGLAPLAALTPFAPADPTQPWRYLPFALDPREAEKRSKRALQQP
jgi:tRNA A-37 threonylcarbamoyl transferase component Bud32